MNSAFKLLKLIKERTSKYASYEGKELKSNLSVVIVTRSMFAY